VRAPQEENWSLGSVPDWITVTKEVIAGIETVFHYQAAENHSYKHRSAAIAIGDAKFELTQWGSPYVAVPFSADFTKVSDTRLGNARRRIENREISRRTAAVGAGRSAESACHSPDICGWAVRQTCLDCGAAFAVQ